MFSCVSFRGCRHEIHDFLPFHRIHIMLGSKDFDPLIPTDFSAFSRVPFRVCKHEQHDLLTLVSFIF